MGLIRPISTDCSCNIVIMTTEKSWVRTRAVVISKFYRTIIAAKRIHNNKILHVVILLSVQFILTLFIVCFVIIRV